MPPKYVVDSSVIVKWLNQQNEQHLKQADQILKDVQENNVELLTSQLADYEIGNALLIKKKLKPTKAKLSLVTYDALPIQRYPQTAERAINTYRLGHRYEITYYDAVFVALAKEHQCPLISDNPKHQEKAKSVKVIPLGDYS